MPSDVNYEDAVEWLEKLRKEANRKGDHRTQRLIEYIREVLWRDNDMRTS